MKDVSKMGDDLKVELEQLAELGRRARGFLADGKNELYEGLRRTAETRARAAGSAVEASALSVFSDAV